MKKLHVFCLVCVLIFAINISLFAAEGETTGKRLTAVWQIAATLNMNNTSNSFLSLLRTQPDGAYAEANLSEAAYWLKLQLGQDSSLAKWFPAEVYTVILSKIVNYNYGDPLVADEYKPPQNASGGVGQVTCDEDPTGEGRDVFVWNWNYVLFTQGAACSLADEIWTCSGLSAGIYVLTYNDWETAESFPTTYLTVTE